jgi:hypothetical protein
MGVEIQLFEFGAYRFLPVSVFHIQEYGELYVSTACILFIYRWCNALKKEMKLDDWICVGG